MSEAAQAEPVLATSVDEHLDRLLSFEATTFPVISIYLNTQSGKNGRDQFGSFVKRELQNRARTYPSSSAERQSFEDDSKRILEFLDSDLLPAANGVAIYACSAGDLFETIQLNAPIEENQLYVYNQPHLYHLARLDDEYPRYAAVITDANSARIFVFGLGETLDTEQVKSKKVQRVKVGGWSQARYQRRVENAHQNHAEEVIGALTKIIQQEGIKQVILAGEPQIMSTVQSAMPQDVAEKVVDVLKLDLKSSDKDIFQATLDRMQEEDSKTDAEKVERLFQQYRARGLAVTGSEETLTALTNGQVDEVLISTALEQSHLEEEPVEAVVAPEIPDSSGGTDSDEPRAVLLADLIVTKAKQTGARTTFIQDASLLENVDGVGAFLRWRA